MKQTPALLAAGLLAAAGSNELLAQPSGQWDFNSGSLAATTGAAITYADGAGGATQSGTRFGTTTSFGLPDIAGQPASVMAFPSNSVGMGFLVATPPAANGGGALVNEWTVVMDVLWPAGSMNASRALLDLDGGALDPNAELFVNAGNAVGVGTFFGSVPTNTWHRLGLVGQLSTNRLRFYLDGVEVGSRDAGGASALDGRWAMTPGSTAGLFVDDDGETRAGFLNSLQVWPVALTRKQMSALAGPQAAGLPSVLPPVPSAVEEWIPAGTVANRTTDLGVVLDAGDTTIQDASISLLLDGVALASPSITRQGTVITVRKANPAPFAVGSSHLLKLTYTDSLAGQKTVEHAFTAALFFEDFEGLVLGDSVDEAPGTPGVWTNTPPAGWVSDNTGVVGFEEPGVGVTEWKGWGFADRDFWVTVAGDQTRSLFTKGQGTVAIADPDEWDDIGSPKSLGSFNALLTTPVIPLAGVAPSTAFIRFDSSWRPEGFDDPPANTNNQTAVVWVTYDGGTPVEVLRWDSKSDGPFFHPDSQNETVLINLANPAGASNMVVRFGCLEAANDWWWAFDNLEINAGATAPTVGRQPQSLLAYSGATAVFQVSAVGSEPLQYQWTKDGAPLAGAAGTNLVLADVQLGDVAGYAVVITNTAGSVTSLVARLEVFAGAITQDLVAHLGFDDAATDSSGRGNHGTLQGGAVYGPGKVGSKAIHLPGASDYVSLGTPADLNFGTETDFTYSFWTRAASVSGDPAFLGNKDWNGGGNPGYVIASDSDGRIQWNLAGAPGGRKDYDSAGGKISDGAWHHVAVTFRRQGTASTYFDGALIQDTSNPTPLDANLNNLDTPAELVTNLGQDGTGTYGSAFTDLDLDDVGIWRRALTPQEIASIHQQGLAGSGLDTATGATAPVVTTQPEGGFVSVGADLTLQVVATGSQPFNYQWTRNGADLSAPPNASLSLTNLQAGQAGDYAVRVSNAAGAVTSVVAKVEVFTGAVTQDLAVHLKLDGNLTDDSGRGNHGTAVGAPTFATGQVGSGAVRIPSGSDYVTLGTPADLNFGVGTDFSVAFWARVVGWNGDAAFIGNKDWDSGNNPGWVLATDSDGRLQWNLAGKADGTNGDRKDYDSAAGAFSDAGWHHVAATFDRSGKAWTYIDGAVRAHRDGRLAVPLGTPENQLDTPVGKATNVGQDGTGAYSAVFTDALLDDLAVWRRVVTPQEVAAIYQAGLAGKDLTQTGSVSPGLEPVSIRVQGGTVTLDWADHPGVKLQKTTSLAAPIQWVDVQGSGTAAEAIGVGSVFYRVVQP